MLIDKVEHIALLESSDTNENTIFLRAPLDAFVSRFFFNDGSGNADAATTACMPITEAAGKLPGCH